MDRMHKIVVIELVDKKHTTYTIIFSVILSQYIGFGIEKNRFSYVQKTFFNVHLPHLKILPPLGCVNLRKLTCTVER